MENIIKLNSVWGSNNYLKKMKKLDGNESKSYILKTDSLTIKAGFIEGKRKFINPSGGPQITEGLLLEEANAVVKSIDFISGYGHIITFE